MGGAKLGKTDLKALNGMVHMVEDLIYPFSVLKDEEEMAYSVNQEPREVSKEGYHHLTDCL